VVPPFTNNDNFYLEEDLQALFPVSSTTFCNWTVTSSLLLDVRF